MKFKIQLGIEPVKGIVKYIKSDYAFDFDPVQSSSYDIMVGDLTISFDENFNAKQVWGYNPIGGWIKKKLINPSAKIGALALQSDIEGVQRIEGSKDWRTYYDTVSGWVCIGTYAIEESDSVVGFATNTVAVLKNNELKSLWLKPMFE